MRIFGVFFNQEFSCSVQQIFMTRTSISFPGINFSSILNQYAQQICKTDRTIYVFFAVSEVATRIRALPRHGQLHITRQVCRSVCLLLSALSRPTCLLDYPLFSCLPVCQPAYNTAQPHRVQFCKLEYLCNPFKFYFRICSI